LQLKKSEYTLVRQLLYSKVYKMASTIIILIVSATVITSICNVAKPAYKKFT